MLCTHIFLYGRCKEALGFYKEAFDAEIQTVIEDPDNEDIIIHSEIMIHNQLLMLNDFGDNDEVTKSGGYQIVVRFDSEGELYNTYEFFKDECTIISPMQSKDYTPCQVRFIDKFDVRWGFYV